MKTHIRIASIIVLGVVLAACSTGSAAPVAKTGSHSAHKTAASGKFDKGAFHHAVRKLWEDHITWTRLYIVSAAAGLPDTQATAERLLRNQADIGDAVKPFYGAEAGERLTALLRDHILTAAELLTAAKTGDTDSVAKAKTKWYANADEIAVFLSSANPKNWPADALKHHMRLHLELTLEEAIARLQSRWTDDIAAYDKVHDAILEMADALSAGIVAQFPQRFI